MSCASERENIEAHQAEVARQFGEEVAEFLSNCVPAIEMLEKGEPPFDKYVGYQTSYEVFCGPLSERSEAFSRMLKDPRFEVNLRKALRQHDMSKIFFDYEPEIVYPVIRLLDFLAEEKNAFFQPTPFIPVGEFCSASEAIENFCAVFQSKYEAASVETEGRISVLLLSLSPTMFLKILLEDAANEYINLNLFVQKEGFSSAPIRLRGLPSTILQHDFSSLSEQGGWLQTNLLALSSFFTSVR